MNLTVTARTVFEDANGDHGEILDLSDGSSTKLWNRKTFERSDGSTDVFEKGQQVKVEDLDSGEKRFATIWAIHNNIIDIQLSDTEWEMRFPSAQFIEPA